MSPLAPHAQAARIIAETFDDEYFARADEAGIAKDETGRTLRAMASVYRSAANRMDAQIAADTKAGSAEVMTHHNAAEARARFRKKPIEITAEQFFFEGQTCKGVHWEKRSADDGEFLYPYVITAHDQRAYLVDGDWIIPEPTEGKFYPCKPDIFEATYESAALQSPQLPGREALPRKLRKDALDVLHSYREGNLYRLAEDALDAILALFQAPSGAGETWNGGRFTPLTQGIHQRADDSFFFVNTHDDERWYWQNFTYGADGEIDDWLAENGPFADVQHAAAAGWVNLQPLAGAPAVAEAYERAAQIVEDCAKLWSDEDVLSVFKPLAAAIRAEAQPK